MLHFSHALTRHVIDDHGATPILVMNKCDLVPPEAVKEWRHFFERRYPQLRVVAASTRSSVQGGGAEAQGLEGQAPSHDQAHGQAPGQSAAAAGRTGAAASVHRGAAAAIMEAVLACEVWREGVGTVKVRREREVLGYPPWAPTISCRQGGESY